MQLALSSILAGPYIQAIFNKCLKQQSPLYTNNFMASSVYLLNHCTLPVPPFRVPSTVNAARTTRPNLILRHASTNSLLMSSSGRPVRRLLTPVVCAVDGAPTPTPPPPPPPPPPTTPTPTPTPTSTPPPPRTPTPPRNNKSDGNIVTRAVMALAGALGALGSSYMSNQKTSITFMKGSSRHKNIDQPAAKVNELLMELMDGEKGKKVPSKLKEMFERNPDEAYFVGMGLIKILASRENFTDGVTIGALLEDFYGKSNSPLLKTGDLFLYMVLIHGMVGEVEKAELSWNKFKSLTEESTTINPLLRPSHEG